MIVFIWYQLEHKKDFFKVKKIFQNICNCLHLIPIKLIIYFFIKNLLQVMGDSLLLSSVFQFSRKIRQSIDKTAGKIRWVFINYCYYWKCSALISIATRRREMFNTWRGNVFSSNLCFKKAMLPMAFFAFRKIWDS